MALEFAVIHRAGQRYHGSVPQELNDQLCQLYVEEKVERERERDRETERQRDRETERQRDRETERQRDRETERQRDRETERERYRDIDERERATYKYER